MGKTQISKTIPFLISEAPRSKLWGIRAEASEFKERWDPQILYID
jgi:hypothetical protein